MRRTQRGSEATTACAGERPSIRVLVVPHSFPSRIASLYRSTGARSTCVGRQPSKALSRKGLNELERCNMSCLSPQPEKSWDIFCLRTLLCLDIRKEGRILSSDLVLLSRDSTMGKIYPPRPPPGVRCVDLREPRVVDEGHGRRAQN